MNECRPSTFLTHSIHLSHETFLVILQWSKYHSREVNLPQNKTTLNFPAHNQVLKHVIAVVSVLETLLINCCSNLSMFGFRTWFFHRPCAKHELLTLHISASGSSWSPTAGFFVYFGTLVASNNILQNFTPSGNSS